MDHSLLRKQISRALGHIFHSRSQAEAHLPPLVPPRHRAHLLLVLDKPGGVEWPLVRAHQLPGARDHVRLLRVPCHALQYTPLRQHDHHGRPDLADGRRHLHQHVGVPEEAERRAL